MEGTITSQSDVELENTDIVPFISYSSNLICGYCCTMCISNNGDVYSFGKNHYFKLGIDYERSIKHPRKITSLKNIKMIDCGKFHTICIDFEGNLFSFGKNKFGELGLDDITIQNTYIPQKIDIPPIDYISCGAKFTICITTDGLLYSFGVNIYGQLGLHCDDKFIATPRQIIGIQNPDILSTGGNSCLCKVVTGEIYVWGDNSYGQLGSEYLGPITYPISTTFPSDIVSIKSGYYHSLLLTAYGYVYSFGKNKNMENEGGKLGLNDTNIEMKNIPTLIKDLPLIKRIECGYNHSMCIDINDKLWVFGYNKRGKLGLGDIEDRHKPTLNESLHDIIDISQRGYHTFVKTINNEIYAFGRNLNMEIIYSKEREIKIPIQVFQDNKEIWRTPNMKSKKKSARN